MLEAWDGLDVASRTEYLTEAAAAAMVSNKKKTNQSQQLQQNNRSSGAAAVSTSSMSGQKRKAALAMSCSSSSSTGEYDHDDYGGGDGSGGGSGRAIASIASPMSRFSTRGASALTSPSYQQQQSFLRSPSSSDRHDHTRLNVPTGGYQPPRVGALCVTYCEHCDLLSGPLFSHTHTNKQIPSPTRSNPSLTHTGG